jgi:MFS family permease
MFNKELLTSQLILNWIVRILFFITLSSLLPTLPVYLREIGGNYSQIGIVMSTFALGVLIFRPLVGNQVDSLGRKAVLLAGIVIFVIAPAMYIFIKSVPTLIPVRIFHGLGLAAFGTASITLITDAAPIRSRGEVISYTGIVNTIAFAGGPILGSYIGDKYGYTILFIFASALSFLTLAVALFIKETKSDSKTQNAVSYFKIISQRRILVSSLIVLLIGLIHGGVMFYIPTFIKDNFATNVGLFFAIYGIAALLVRIVVGPASDRWGRGPFIVLALALLGTGILILSWSTSTDVLFIAAVFYGLGFGAHQPTLTALVADNTTEETRGKIFSFYYGGFDLGISIAGFVLGAIAEWYGIRTMFLVCFFLTLIALATFSTIIEQSVLHSLRCAMNFRGAKGSCDDCYQDVEIARKQTEEYFE